MQRDCLPDHTGGLALPCPSHLPTTCLIVLGPSRCAQQEGCGVHFGADGGSSQFFSPGHVCRFPEAHWGPPLLCPAQEVLPAPHTQTQPSAGLCGTGHSPPAGHLHGWALIHGSQGTPAGYKVAPRQYPWPGGRVQGQRGSPPPPRQPDAYMALWI
jgi:hypothetical protein